MAELSVPLMGIRFREYAAQVLQCLGYDEPLELRREPHNEYDSNAIAVWLPKGWTQSRQDELSTEVPDLPADFIFEGTPVMLGYIPKGVAKEWAPVFDREQAVPPAKLGFSAAGKPSVIVEINDG